MKLILSEHSQVLKRQWRRGKQVPVVKLFNPMGAATWLISEQDPAHPDQLFGLCDMGFGCPELGYVSLSELQDIQLGWGLGIERDLLFRAQWPLDIYAEAARFKGAITTQTEDLLDALVRMVAVDWNDPAVIQEHVRAKFRRAEGELDAICAQTGD